MSAWDTILRYYSAESRLKAGHREEKGSITVASGSTAVASSVTISSEGQTILVLLEAYADSIDNDMERTILIRGKVFALLMTCSGESLAFTIKGIQKKLFLQIRQPQRALL